MYNKPRKRRFCRVHITKQRTPKIMFVNEFSLGSKRGVMNEPGIRVCATR